MLSGGERKRKRNPSWVLVTLTREGIRMGPEVDLSSR